MIREELEGSNLGQKHKSYNTLVNNAIKTDELQLDHFDADEPDVLNLIKIDVASAKRNVNYLLKVLVCDDLLYISRVLKKCKWFITDNNYSHIINPQYLYSTLLIKMCTKGANKLMKQIQIHLKDEKRVEQFYEYETNPKESVKWLPHCSIEFIKNKISQHTDHLKLSELKRISARSIILLEIYLNNCEFYMKSNALQATTFLLHTDTTKYLDLLKDFSHYNHLKFSPMETKLIMENNSNLIISDFMQFQYCIHIPTFITILKNENIEEFLLNLSRKEENRHGGFIDRKRLQQFLEAMHESQRFEFVRKVFIEKIFKDESTALPQKEKSALKFLHDALYTNEYFWYQYAPFETAFNNITKMIGTETYVADQKSMLSILFISAKKNEEHIHSILEYLSKQVQNYTFDLKYHLIQEFIVKLKFHTLKIGTWELLQNIILKSDLDDSEEAQMLMRVIAVYKILNSQIIPDIITQRLNFNSYKMIRNKLNETEKDILFTYLYNSVCKHLKEINEKGNEINERIKILQDAFNLLIDWDKNLKEYPFLLNEVKRLIDEVDSTSSNNIDFIYNMNKSWRKYMFEDSLRLKLNNYTLINAIKHDPLLIKRYSNQKVTKQLTNIPSISQFLKKIKIYFSSSLAEDLRLNFMGDVNNLSNHTNVIRGILDLYSREDILNILEKYVPKVSKINEVMEVDRNTVSLQRHFAKNMHLSRPQPPPDVILSYAKGDYLQYALPSLLSIFYNLNKIKSRIYIPKLLDSRISLQKHGIRLAFSKLESHELTEIFSTMWRNNKNYTIRSEIFKVVFELLCKERDAFCKDEIWKLLTILIDNLTLKEEKVVYTLLFKIDKIPPEFQSKYYVKVYPFLENLANSDIDKYSYSLLISFIPHAIKLIDELPSQFVAKILLEHINKKINENKYEYWEYSIIPLISAHLLSSKDINSQMKKHDEIFIPVLIHSINVWDNLENNRPSKRNDLQKLLDHLCQDLQKFSFNKNYIIPIELFLTIQKGLEESFPIQENYVMLTKWKLTLALIKAIEKRQSSNWNDSCLGVSEEFGRICVSYLKEDCSNYFPYIYTLFVKALRSVLNILLEKEAIYKVYRSMLLDKDLIEAYLVVLKLIPKHESNETMTDKNNELHNIILGHPSLEVKIHYHYRFKTTM